MENLRGDLRKFEEMLEEIIWNKVSLEGSPTIELTLPHLGGYKSLLGIAVVKLIVLEFIIWTNIMFRCEVLLL